MATSWAMVLDYEMDYMFQLLGHDGSEILYPELADPERRRSFHPAEFVELAHYEGLAIVQIELNPCWADPNNEPEMLEIPGGNEEHLKRWLSRYEGVITGQTVPKNKWHAVAWDRNNIMDPSGHRRQLEEFIVHTFWAAVPIGD